MTPTPPVLHPAAPPSDAEVAAARYWLRRFVRLDERLPDGPLLALEDVVGLAVSRLSWEALPSGAAVDGPEFREARLLAVRAVAAAAPEAALAVGLVAPVAVLGDPAFPDAEALVLRPEAVAAWAAAVLVPPLADVREGERPRVAWVRRLWADVVTPDLPDHVWTGTLRSVGRRHAAWARREFDAASLLERSEDVASEVLARGAEGPGALRRRKDGSFAPDDRVLAGRLRVRDLVAQDGDRRDPGETMSPGAVASAVRRVRETRAVVADVRALLAGLTPFQREVAEVGMGLLAEGRSGREGGFPVAEVARVLGRPLSSVAKAADAVRRRLAKISDFAA